MKRSFVFLCVVSLLAGVFASCEMFKKGPENSDEDSQPSVLTVEEITGLLNGGKTKAEVKEILGRDCSINVDAPGRVATSA